jgi:hypothetical protein
MSVTEYVAHYITARDLGLTIRDALIDHPIGAYTIDNQLIATSAEQVLSVDYNDPCNLFIEVPSGAVFSIKIEQIKTAARAKMQKELFIEPTQPEYGPRNV